MTIVVVPIPSTIELAAPSFILGTTNTAGAATSAVASDSTLLAFDTTLPDAITYGQSGAVGSATVASRRDHAHAMAASDAVSAATQAEQEAGSSTTAFTTPGRQQFHPSAVKAWAFIAGDGSLSSPDYNVASSTKTGTGVFAITWDVDMTGTVYACGATVAQSSYFGHVQSGGPITTGVTWYLFDDDGTAGDAAMMCWAMGDQ